MAKRDMTSDSDSDFRVTNPGMHAMRQLTRSVSRRTKQLLQPSTREKQPQSTDEVHPPAMANGYYTYEFPEPSTYWRGPPQPSGIHRRSMSFDNLVVLPGTLPRRSTAPTAESPRMAPGEMALPSASTWNSGSTMTRALAALEKPLSQQPGHELREQWLASLSHPLSTTIDSEYYRTSLSVPRPATAQALTIDTSAFGGLPRTDYHPTASPTQPKTAPMLGEYRESFSGPAQLDAEHSESSKSSLFLAHVPPPTQPFQDGRVQLSDSDVELAMRDSPTAVTRGFSFNGTAGTKVAQVAGSGNYADRNQSSVSVVPSVAASNKSASRFVARTIDSRHIAPTHISLAPPKLPAMPKSAGHVIASSPLASQPPVSRPVDRKDSKRRGNIQRVIDGISRGFSRMRTRRSASQPATPLEMRQRMEDSVQRELDRLPGSPQHMYFFFNVNPAAPVADRKSTPPDDSPTVSVKQVAPKTHRRNPTFPSSNFDQFQESLEQMADDNVQIRVVESRAASINELPPVKCTSPVFSRESLDRLYMEAGRSVDGIPLVFPPTASHSMTHSDSQLEGAAEEMTADGSVQNESRDLARNGNGVSEVVQQKLTDGFLQSVHISTRLGTELSSESSYGTFVRFHNSGELSGIYVVDQKPHHVSMEDMEDMQDTDMHRPPYLDSYASDYDRFADQYRAGTVVPMPYASQNPSGLQPKSSYHRNQAGVMKFVETMRVNRQASARRKTEADAHRVLLHNQQAMLDAALYIEQQQELQRKRTPSRDSGHGSTPPVVASRRTLQRRNEEAPGCLPRAKEAKQRRHSVFGIFCALGNTTPSPPESPMVPAVSAFSTQVPANRNKPLPPTATKTRYVDKDLPPRPTTAHEPQHTATHGTYNQLHRSQSFSHIEDTVRLGKNWSPEDSHVAWHDRKDHPLGIRDPTRGERISYPIGSQPSMVSPVPDEASKAADPLQIHGILESIRVPLAQDSHVDHGRRGFIAGLMDRITGHRHHQGRPVSGVSEIRRKLGRRHTRRHTVTAIEDTVVPEIQETFVPRRAPSPPPNVMVNIPVATLSEDICENIANTSIENAQSSTQKRMYAQFLNALRETGSQINTLDRGPAHDSGALPRLSLTNSSPHENSSESAKMYPELGLVGRSPRNSADIREELSQEELDDLNGWRDSAITSHWTQTSGVPSAKGKEIEVPEFMIAGNQPDLPSTTQGLANASNDELVSVPRRQMKAWRISQSVPHSHVTSRVASTDGSFGDMFSGDHEILRHHAFSHLPGLEGIGSPTTTTSIANTPIQFARSPADEHDRQLGMPVPPLPTTKVFQGDAELAGYRMRPTSAESGGANRLSVVRNQHDTSTSYESPVSETGTGKTQILDFEEHNINNGSAEPIPVYRRPSARPAIKEIGDLVWGDTNPTATAAVSLDTTDVPSRAQQDASAVENPSNDIQATKTPSTLNNPDDAGAGAESSGSVPPAGKGLKADLTFNKLKAVQESESGAVAEDPEEVQKPEVAVQDSAEVQEPEVVAQEPVADAAGQVMLAELVKASPDPRSLIYDANSRFGSMGSQGSPASDTQEPVRHIDSLFAEDGKPLAYATTASIETSNHNVTQSSTSVLEGIPLGDSVATVDPSSMESASVENKPDPIKESKLRMDALHIDTSAVSDALAHISVQAMPSHTSPATQQTQLTTPTDSPAISAMQVNGASNRPLSLRDYVEQQKIKPDKLTLEQAHKQINFRVSLFEHVPDYDKKPRSVSLPPPQNPNSGPPQALMPMFGAQDSTADDTRQRTRSVYDNQAPPAAAALGIGARNLPATFQSLAMALNEELADRVLFNSLLGDGGALEGHEMQAVQRQSGIALPSPAQPLFDPVKDTGENGVPDSVVRAFMAGDLTAIDRFFEHVMKLTAPASVFDGDMSDNDDWFYGLDGPPEEILAQRRREAAKKAKAKRRALESEEMDAMVEGLAGGSKIGGLPQTDIVVMPVVSDDAIMPTLGAMNEDSRELSPPPTNTPVAFSPPLQQQEEEVMQKEVAGQEDVPQKVSPTVSSESSSGRKIAVPKSRISRDRTSGSLSPLPVSSPVFSPSPVFSSSPMMSASPGFSASPIMSSSPVLPSPPPQTPQLLKSQQNSPLTNSSWVQHFYAESPKPSSPPQQQSPALPQITVITERPSDVEQQPRSPQHTSVQSEQRDPERIRNKKILMTRLRVLEGLIQRNKLEEARLQPPPTAQQRPPLAAELESIASIYESSLDINVDSCEFSPRARRDIALSQPSLAADSRNSNENSRPVQRRPTIDTRRVPAQGDVLRRLRQSAESRQVRPFRASMLNRAFAPPSERSSEKGSLADPVSPRRGYRTQDGKLSPMFAASGRFSRTANLLGSG